MKNEGFCPNAVTFVCILKACGGLGKLEKGKEIHVEVIEHDCEGKNMFIATGLVDMYAKCGEISKAREVFDEFTIQEVESCNALIARCISNMDMMKKHYNALYVCNMKLSSQMPIHLLVF